MAGSILDNENAALKKENTGSGVMWKINNKQQKTKLWEIMRVLKKELEQCQRVAGRGLDRVVRKELWGGYGKDKT